MLTIFQEGALQSSFWLAGRVEACVSETRKFPPHLHTRFYLFWFMWLITFESGCGIGCRTVLICHSMTIDNNYANKRTKWQVDGWLLRGKEECVWTGKCFKNDEMSFDRTFMATASVLDCFLFSATLIDRPDNIPRAAYQPEDARPCDYFDCSAGKLCGL